MSNSIFTGEGIRKVNVTFSSRDIKTLTKDWKVFVNDLKPYNYEFEGKGIVICAGGYGYFTCCWILVNTLRNEKQCTLPIQVWYKGEEMSAELIEALSALDVTCHNILDYTEEDIDGYALKPMAILSSSFKEVLFIDADNICTINPELLFDLPEYKEFGAVFWPDFWETEKSNPIWDILNIPRVSMKEQESGQLLINKERCWKEIHLAAYFNIHNYIYYLMLLGDKDTFRFAWMALGSPFYFVEKEPSSCGYIDSSGSFAGHTMIQHLPNGESLFLHRNLLKWHKIKCSTGYWENIKRFKSSPKQKKYLYYMKNNKYIMDLEGDVELLDFKKELGDIELACLKYLQELRLSDWYISIFGNELKKYNVL